MKRLLILLLALPFLMGAELTENRDRRTSSTLTQSKTDQPIAYGSEIATSPTDPTDLKTYIDNAGDGGGGGLSSVAIDDTLQGDGTSDDALGLALDQVNRLNQIPAIDAKVADISIEPVSSAWSNVTALTTGGFASRSAQPTLSQASGLTYVVSMTGTSTTAGNAYTVVRIDDATDLLDFRVQLSGDLGTFYITGLHEIGTTGGFIYGYARHNLFEGYTNRIQQRTTVTTTHFRGESDAENVVVDASGFSDNLGSTDTDVQTALETLNALGLGVTSIAVAGTGLAIDQATGAVTLTGSASAGGLEISAYSSTATYSRGSDNSIVTHSNGLFIYISSTSRSSGHDPDNQPGYWLKLSEGMAYEVITSGSHRIAARTIIVDGNNDNVYLCTTTQTTPRDLSYIAAQAASIGGAFILLNGGGSGNGSSTFTGLTDTPSALGTSGQILQVNSAEDALEFVAASSGTGASTELWTGDIAVGTANQWVAAGTDAVPATAKWILFNGGALTSGGDDGAPADWKWINAAAWRLLTADTTGTSVTDGTAMQFAEWPSTDIESTNFTRRDVKIGRTSTNTVLITSMDAGEDFNGAAIRYITGFGGVSGGIEELDSTQAYSKGEQAWSGTGAAFTVWTANQDIAADSTAPTRETPQDWIVESGPGSIRGLLSDIDVNVLRRGDIFWLEETGGDQKVYFTRTAGSYTTASDYQDADNFIDLTGAGGSGGSGITQSDADDRYLNESSNLSDLDSAATARTNLGLGSAATQESSAFLTQDSGDSRYLNEASNLSDLPNAGTARTNLGLGTAATRDTGTAQNNVPILDASGDVDADIIPIDNTLQVDGSAATLGVNTQRVVQEVSEWVQHFASGDSHDTSGHSGKYHEYTSARTPIGALALFNTTSTR